MLQKDSAELNIDILEMQITDVKQVSEIEKECFSSPWSEKDFEIELGKEGSITLISVANDLVVGFVNAQLVLDEIYINNVAVTQKIRKQGVGELLLKGLENKVEGIASFITLEVRKSNIPAIKLYEKCGYQEVGLRKNFYEKPTEDAILMTKYL